MRTSATHPLQIAELAVPGTPGRLGLTFCPGKKQPDALTGAWDRDLASDLEAIAAWGATAVVTLMEAHELARLGVPGLGDAVAARGMVWHHLPIRDVDVPDGSFEAAWTIAGAELARRLADGERILLHCKGGLGRTGTIAARLLVEHGMQAEEAILRVRAARRGAIETPAQEAYVRAVVARPHAASADPDRRSRIRGCLLTGACGDALGAPVEFLRLAEIRRRYGPGGITMMDRAYGRVGAITDDTQMTLFTAEGLVLARRDGQASHAADVAAVHAAYLRWLTTQGSKPGTEVQADGWLLQEKALWSRRAPGNTCLSALQATTTLGGFAKNDSKGCGGVMRVAPAAFVGAADPFRLGADLARLTHGHPSGYLASGYLVALLAALANGTGLTTATDLAEAELLRHAGHEETLAAVRLARDLAAQGTNGTVPRALGEGWVAEEALAIALWATLAHDDPVAAMTAAANHDGDTDSTASIAGQILGTLHGPAFLPQAWLEQLELKEVIERLAGELAGCR